MDFNKGTWIRGVIAIGLIFTGFVFIHVSVNPATWPLDARQGFVTFCAFALVLNFIFTKIYEAD